jgi:hypothetical protein
MYVYKWNAGCACLFFPLFCHSVISVSLPSPFFLSYFFHSVILRSFHLSSLGFPIHFFLAALLPFFNPSFLLSRFLLSVVLSLHLCFTCHVSFVSFTLNRMLASFFCLSSPVSSFLSYFVISCLLPFRSAHRFLNLFSRFFFLLFQLKATVVSFSTLSRIASFIEFRV